MNTFIITLEMTELFNSCTRQKDYKEFYNKYKTDIEICARDLEHVKASNKLCHFIAQNVSELFTILTKTTTRNHRRPFTGCCQMELHEPQFIDDLRTAIGSKDWQPFYQKYRKHADTIIKEARRQRSLSIEFESQEQYYTTLESRDNAIRPRANNSEIRPMDRPSPQTSQPVEDRSHINLLPCEPANGGNNEAEISPGPSSSLEEYGEIAVIELEDIEQEVVHPERSDPEQSTSSGSFLSSIDVQSLDLSPPFPASSSNEGNDDRLGSTPIFQSNEEIPEVGTSANNVAEHAENLSSMLAGLRNNRNNEVPTQREGLPGSTDVLRINSSSYASERKFQELVDKHKREMWKLERNIFCE